MTKAVEVDPSMKEARKGLEAAASMVQIVQSKSLSMVEAPPADSFAGTPLAQAGHEKRGELVITASGLKRQSSGLDKEKGTREDHRRLIEISNGNGISHMARKVGMYLNKNGFGEPRLTNASHFGFAETTIYYCEGYLQTAYQLAQSIPGYQIMEKAERLDRPETKVKVRIGKDLIPYAPVFEKS